MNKDFKYKIEKYISKLKKLKKQSSGDYRIIQLNNFINQVKEFQNSRQAKIPQYSHIDYQKYINEAERLINKIKDGMSPNHEIIADLKTNGMPRFELAEIDCNEQYLPSVDVTIDNSYLPSITSLKRDAYVEYAMGRATGPPEGWCNICKNKFEELRADMDQFRAEMAQTRANNK